MRTLIAIGRTIDGVLVIVPAQPDAPLAPVTSVDDDIMAAYLEVKRDGVPCSGVDWAAVEDKKWGD